MVSESILRSSLTEPGWPEPVEGERSWFDKLTTSDESETNTLPQHTATGQAALSRVVFKSHAATPFSGITPLPKEPLLPVESAALRGLLGLVIVSLYLQLLALIGSFTLPFLLPPLIAAAVLLWLEHDKIRAFLRSSLPQSLAVAAFFLAMTFVYLPPAQFVLGGWDPGVYFTSAAGLARTGAFTTQDPILSRLRPEAAAAFTTEPPGLHPTLQPGFYVNQDSGAVTSQFPLLLTTWTAFGIALAGIRGGLAMPFLINLMALLYFYLLARRLMGGGGGITAAALLAFNAVQVWHGKMSFSEELLQVFLFGGLWSGVLWQSTHSRMAAVAAGLALGLLPLVKTEGLVVAFVALSLFCLVPALRLTPHKRLLALGFFPGALTAGVVWATVAQPLALDQGRSSWALLLFGLALVVVAARFRSFKEVIARLFGERAVQLPERLGVRHGAFALAAVGALAAAGFAYVETQQTTEPSFLVSLWQGMFLSPLDGVLAGLCVLALVMRQRSALSFFSQPAMAALLLTSILYLAIFWVYQRGQDDVPLFMWSTRRLLPTIIPLLMLMEAWALMQLIDFLPVKGWRPVVVAVVALVAVRWPDAAPVFAAREYEGSLAAISAVAARTEPESVLLLDGDDTGVRFAAPLRFLEGRLTYLLQTNWSIQDSDLLPRGIDDLVTEARAQGRSVYYLSSQPRSASRYLVPYQPELVNRVAVSLPELERTSLRRPQEMLDFNAEIHIFKIGDRASDLPTGLPLRIDLGDETFPGYSYLRSGFYMSQQTQEGVRYRWTASAAVVTIPPGTRSRVLSLRAASGRPAGLAPLDVTISCGSRAFKSLTVGSEFSAYSFPIPAECRRGSAAITLSTDPWSFSEMDIAADNRVFGVMLDWIEFK